MPFVISYNCISLLLLFYLYLSDHNFFLNSMMILVFCCTYNNILFSLCVYDLCIVVSHFAANCKWIIRDIWKPIFLHLLVIKVGKDICRALKVSCIQCFENENGRKFCLEKINLIIYNELHKVCHASTNSVLQDLHQFTWNQERKSP